jgi:hypothetical protein
MEYSRGTAILNLLPDSRLRQASRISLHQSPCTAPGRWATRIAEFDDQPRRPRLQTSFRRSITMSGSLHPNAVHRRRHRKEKRNKLRAQIAAAPAAGRAALEAKLQKTYSLGFGMQPSKSGAHDAAAVPVPLI